MSQESLAKLVGITAPYLSKVKKYHLDSGEHPVDKLASFLNFDHSSNAITRALLMRVSIAFDYLNYGQKRVIIHEGRY